MSSPVAGRCCLPEPGKLTELGFGVGLNASGPLVDRHSGHNHWEQLAAVADHKEAAGIVRQGLSLCCVSAAAAAAVDTLLAAVLAPVSAAAGHTAAAVPLAVVAAAVADVTAAAALVAAAVVVAVA